MDGTTVNRDILGFTEIYKPPPPCQEMDYEVVNPGITLCLWSVCYRVSAHIYVQSVISAGC